MVHPAAIDTSRAAERRSMNNSPDRAGKAGKSGKAALTGTKSEPSPAALSMSSSSQHPGGHRKPSFNGWSDIGYASDTPQWRKPLKPGDALRLAKDQTAKESPNEGEAINMQEAFGRAMNMNSPSPAPRPIPPSIESPGDRGAQSREPTANRRGSMASQQARGLPRDYRRRVATGPPYGTSTRKPAAKDARSGLAPTKQMNGNSPDSPSIVPKPVAPEKYGDDTAAKINEDCGDDSFPSSTNASPAHGNWDLDKDFTASDVLTSHSPRVRAAETNGMGLGQTRSSSGSSVGAPRRSNIRLNQIRDWEAEVAETELGSGKAFNPKMVRVRAQELLANSAKTIADGRLEDIRQKLKEAGSEPPERVGVASRDKTPEVPYIKPTKSKESRVKRGTVDERATKGNGEHIRDRPVPVYRTFNKGKRAHSPHTVAEKAKQLPEAAQNRPEEPDEAQKLLRELGQAVRSSTASSSTSQTEKMQAAGEIAAVRSVPAPKAGDGGESRRPGNTGSKSCGEKRTVGFDLASVETSSSDPPQEKRHSRGSSDADPTDRLEAEKNLFAPRDNYSEAESLRALSPDPSEKSEAAENEATPRPVKVDPLAMPTPRVSGAYVNTPATVKAEDRFDSKAEPLEPEPSLGLRRRKPSGPASSVQDHSGVTSSKTGQSTARSASAPGPRAGRRSRSRPQINTAHIPTAKDDLRQIHQKQGVEDSTLEDFEHLAKQEFDSDELERFVNESKAKAEEDVMADMAGLSAHEREQQKLERMNKSLEAGLMSIRSAKRGISRLEVEVGRPDRQAIPQTSTPNPSDQPATERPPGRVVALQPSDGAVYIAFPALYHRKPKFRLTWFGIVNAVFFTWYLLESAFCQFYEATPYACPANRPCDWSPNEPYFPYTMPFMLDEWTTGGKGRTLAWRAGEQIGDALAELSDWITGTDFSQFDERYMNVWERRRHRRRLKRHGLGPTWAPPPEYEDMYASWRAALKNGEDPDVETMAFDEKLSEGD